MPLIRALVAVTHDNDARKLSRFLGERGCVVDVRTQGDQALELARQARGQAKPVDLLLADHRLLILDGLSLITRVHRLEPGTITCLMIDAHRIDDRLRSEARQLGCHHLLPTPLDFGKLQGIVERLHRQRGGHTASYTPASGKQIASGSHTPQTASGSSSGSDDNTPFFGTRRLAPATRKIGTGPTPRSEPPLDPDQGSGVFDSLLKPSEVVEPRPQSHAYRSMSDRGGGTRRSVTGTYDPNLRADPSSQRGRRSVTGSFDEPQSSPTQRIRRGVTGRIDREQQDDAAREHTNRLTRAAIKVRCAHCGEPFSVVRKPISYTMPCIHCGSVNTINPG